MWLRVLPALTLTLLLALSIDAAAQPSEAGKAVGPPPVASVQQTPAASQAAPQPAYKFGGYMFGDLYWVAQNHRPDVEGQNGFWFRRIYFTYDHTLAKAFATRFRLEMNSPGDFRSNTKLTPYIKDAYLRWTHGRHSILFGISPTPTWEVIETVWGYRSVEKTPLDLQRFDGSRDFGVAVQGALDAGSRLRYHVMLGNGSDTGSETDRNKALRGSLRYEAPSGVLVEGYAGWQDEPGKAQRSTYQGFVVYRKPRGRIALHVAEQARRSAVGQTERLDLLSVFGAAQPAEKVWVFGRVDRMFDPNPEGDKIPYLPFSATAKSLFTVIGLDVVPENNVHLMPNVELVRYDATTAGVTPGVDVVPRLTVYFTW